MTFLKNISSSKTDHELVHEYKLSGKADLLGELYQRYMDMVYGVCLKYFKEPEDAKDCVLNIFEELVNKLKKHEIDNFKGWLYQLTKNHCLMKLRRKKIIPVNIDVSTVQSEQNEHLDDVFEKEENYKQMEHCLSQLSQEQRQAIELFYIQDKCYKEIAEVTGIEVSKVRSFIQNGRRNLKICMDKKTLEQLKINGITTER